MQLFINHKWQNYLEQRLIAISNILREFCDENTNNNILRFSQHTMFQKETQKKNIRSKNAVILLQILIPIFVFL